MLPETIMVNAFHPLLGPIRKIPLKTHGIYECEGRFCCVHNPSVHPLRESPRIWIIGQYQMKRICRHGAYHPDPDDMAFKRDILGWSEEFLAPHEKHDCDFCCTWDGPVS